MATLNYKTSLAVTLALLFSLILGANPLKADSIFENFMTSSAPGWVLGGSAVLTAGSPDPAGQGWLRLTPRTGNDQFGYAYYDTKYAAPFGFAVEFEFGAWGGSGADGFTVFLFNGDTPIFQIGEAGGSLGYANGCNGAPGLRNGFVGVAFDEWGNFSSTEPGVRCKIDGPGQRANSVTVRGRAMDGYPYVTHRQLPTSTQRIDCPSSICGTTRPSPSTYYRKAIVLVMPTATAYSVAVYMRHSQTGEYDLVLPKTDLAAPTCSAVKIGFAASTGGYTNAHEIRNLKIDIFDSYTDLAITGGFTSSLYIGQTTQFRADVTNLGPALDTGPIKVDLKLPTGLTYNSISTGSPWSCNAVGQDVTCTYPGAIQVNATLPSLLVTVDVSSSVGGQTLQTTATVSGDAFDENQSNNKIVTSRYVNGGPSSGTKNLYAYFKNSGTGTTPLAAPNGNTLQRRRPGTDGMPQSNTGQINGGGSSTTDWMTLTPSLVSNVVLPAGKNVDVSLCLKRIGNVNARSVRVEIKQQNSAATSALGLSRTFNIPNTTAGVMETFSIPIPSNWVLTPSNPLQMRVINQTTSTTRHIRVFSSDAGCGTGQYSRADIYTENVVNVDNGSLHTVAWPGVNAITCAIDDGSTIYMRSEISDPFGSFDIAKAVLEVFDKNNTRVIGPTNMNQVDENTLTGKKNYELGVTVPSWTASSYTIQITAHEGVEETIVHRNIIADFSVNPPPPMLSVTKLASSASVNPGSEVTYTVNVSNTGAGAATGVVARDLLPSFMSLAINTFGAMQPIKFVDGIPSSGLTPAGVEYSNNNGSTWLYTPISGGGGSPSGFDANITNFRVALTGTMPPGSSFSFQYKALLD